MRCPNRIDAAVDDEARLFAWLGVDRDPAAREAIVRHFMPLARQLAQRYRYVEDLDDLEQVAALGLMKAIDPSNPSADSRSPPLPSRRSWVSSSATYAIADGRCDHPEASRSWRRASLVTPPTCTPNSAAPPRPPSSPHAPAAPSSRSSKPSKPRPPATPFPSTRRSPAAQNPTLARRHRSRRRRLRRRGGHRASRRPDARAFRTRADGLAPALQRGSDAVADRRDRRGLPDARLAAGSQRSRATAHSGRRRTFRRRWSRGLLSGQDGLRIRSSMRIVDGGRLSASLPIVLRRLALTPQAGGACRRPAPSARRRTARRRWRPGSSRARGCRRSSGTSSMTTRVHAPGLSPFWSWASNSLQHGGDPYRRRECVLCTILRASRSPRRDNLGLRRRSSDHAGPERDPDADRRFPSTDQ